MLQQTQVSRVVDYFGRFVTRFPTVAELAVAAEDDVLSLWSGLGYYSRGRNLHRAAKVVVAEHGGVFPSSLSSLRALPGVGDYTAAAVASLAGGARAAVVDGNVVRVLSRLTDEPGVVTDKAVAARLRALADDLITAAASPATHNEAIMELGALVCTPRSPSCGACPWQQACRARAHETVALRPVKAKKKARPVVELVAVVVRVRGGLYLERRKSAGLFGGLWEPPTEQLDGAEPIAVARAVCRARDVDAGALKAPVVVERTLTHRALRFHIFTIDVDEPARAPSDARGEVFQATDLDAVGISSAVRAVLAAAPPSTSGDGDKAKTKGASEGPRKKRSTRLRQR